MADGEDASSKAKLAAQRAEQGLSASFLGEAPGALDDSKLKALLKNEGAESEASKLSVKYEAEKAKERMDTFEAQLKDVRDRKTSGKSKEELNLRGVRIGAATGDETQWIDEPEKEVKKKSRLEEMDAKLKQVLKGEEGAKKKRDDRLRTETGEELLYAEFAPGASISSFALPENFDPLNPPLPSEMRTMQQAAEKAARGELTEEEAAMLPLPSQMSAPSKSAKLYDRNAVGVMDDSLFSIKSVFDDTGIKVPGKTTSRDERKAREKGLIPMSKDDVDPLEDLVARDRAALRATKAASAAEFAAGKSDTIGQSVSKVMGLIVVADFFVIIGFLGWLIVSIMYQYAVCGGLTPETGPICANPVYDSWYALWVPVIQPALGILMASVILERTIKAVIPGATEE